MARVSREDRLVTKIVLSGEPFAAVVFIVRRVFECQDRHALDLFRLRGIDLLYERVGPRAEKRDADQRVLRQRIGEIVVPAAYLVGGIFADHPFANILKLIFFHLHPASSARLPSSTHISCASARSADCL